MTAEAGAAGGAPINHTSAAESMPGASDKTSSTGRRALPQPSKVSSNAESSVDSASNGAKPEGGSFFSGIKSRIMDRATRFKNETAQKWNEGDRLTKAKIVVGCAALAVVATCALVGLAAACALSGGTLLIAAGVGAGAACVGAGAFYSADLISGKEAAAVAFSGAVVCAAAAGGAAAGVGGAFGAGAATAAAGGVGAKMYQDQQALQKQAGEAGTALENDLENISDKDQKAYAKELATALKLYAESGQKADDKEVSKDEAGQSIRTAGDILRDSEKWKINDDFPESLKAAIELAQTIASDDNDASGWDVLGDAAKVAAGLDLYL